MSKCVSLGEIYPSTLTMKIPQFLSSVGLVACASAGLFLQSANAQSVTGSLNAYNHPSYAGIAAHFRIDDLEVGGSQFFGGTGNIFCSDLDGTSLDEDSQTYPRPVTLTFGALEDMDIWDRYSTPQNESLAMAQVRWLIDNRYDSHFLNPGSDASEKQYALQNVIWEIMGDGGTAAGLDFSTGNIDRSKFSNSRRYGTTLWTIMNDLLDDVENSGVDETYVATSEIYAALDSRSGYQDYIFLANEVTQVPEPNAALLGLLGLALILRRRSR